MNQSASIKKINITNKTVNIVWFDGEKSKFLVKNGDYPGSNT